MARQRAGQSRFKLLVAIVIVVLCFLHLPINGSQTLAVPGSGRETTRASLEKLTVRKLKTKLREKGLKVSGRKADLVERLVKYTAMESMEIKRVRSGKRKIPHPLKLADPATDVFIPLDETVQQLEALLQKKRVVFLRAGVASGKSTLAHYLCREHPFKYLQVYPPAFDSLTSQHWQIQFMAALENEPSAPDVAKRSMEDAVKYVHDNDRVLVFDECHLLFSCPDFLNMFLKPGHLWQPPMMLLLSAASEAVDMHGAISRTPAEITAKFIWTPPMPDAKALVNQLAQADVYLSQDAIEFFLTFCCGHRGLFIRSMEWVQEKQSAEQRNSTPWNLTRALGEASQAWDTENWIYAPDDSLMGKLQTIRAIRVNGYFASLENIPEQFVKILCEGPTDDIDIPVRRMLAIHGFVLPTLRDNMGAEQNEFQELDWACPGAKYGVANYLMASYYRQALAKKRQLTVEIDTHPASCIDFLLRALPSLLFAEVVAISVKDHGQAVFHSDISGEELPFEVHYTFALIRVLKRLGFRTVSSLESPPDGKAYIYYTTQDCSAFAIEAVVAARGRAAIEEHRKRFKNVSKTNYANAKHKCLLIIGRKGHQLRKLVQDTWGGLAGIEIVGLAANSAHTGYHVYVKQQEQQGKEVLDFYIPCDGVARSFSFKDEEPFFEISSAQKFKSIQPGWISLEHSNRFKLTGLGFVRTCRQ